MRGVAILIAVGLIPSGALAAAQLAATPQDTMTLERLRGVFQEAYINAEIDEDGDLQISERGGITLWVQLDDTRRLLNFFTVGSLRPDATHEEKLVFLNELNRSIIGATFYLARSDLMIADSYVSFESGVSNERVMNSYRWFRDAVLAAIRRDETGLLGHKTRILAPGACPPQQPGCARTKT
jgi:hypothetical protein